MKAEMEMRDIRPDCSSMFESFWLPLYALPKKGLLNNADMMARKMFACKVLKILPENFWTEGIGFYFDGAGFAQKYLETKTMAWRKVCEGLMEERRNWRMQCKKCFCHNSL